MIKNIISYVIPFGGLLALIFSFHYLDKYAATPIPKEESINTDDNVE
ncbi:hypothetical protein ACNQFZ_14915 [Schinkia sp. CFF1]